MTREERRLDLIKIVHHVHHNDATVIDIVRAYEAFLDEVRAEQDAPTTPKKKSAT